MATVPDAKSKDQETDMVTWVNTFGSLGAKGLIAASVALVLASPVHADDSAAANQPMAITETAQSSEPAAATAPVQATPAASAKAKVADAVRGGDQDFAGRKSGAASSVHQSKVVSDGKFTAPELAESNIGKIGLAADKTMNINLFTPLDRQSEFFTLAFGGVATITLLLTLLIAFALTKTVDSSGNPRRAFTVGSKLTVAFGGLMTLMLGVCAISASGMTHGANASAAAIEAGDLDAAVQELQSKATGVRLAARIAMQHPTEASFARFTNQVSEAAAISSSLKSQTAIPEISKELEELDALVRDYDKTATVVLSKLHVRDAMISKQMSPAVMRVVTLVTEIAETATKDGDPVAGAAAFDVVATVNNARVNFFRYLVLNDPKIAEDSKMYVNQAIEKLEALAAEIQNPKRRLWLSEATQGLAFYRGMVESTVKIDSETTAAVTGTLDQIGPKLAAAGARTSDTLNKIGSDLKEQNIASMTKSKATLGIAVAISMIMAIGMGLTMVRSISSAVKRVLSVLQSVAGGDLMQQPINSVAKDELGELARATDKMAASLRDVITEVSISTTEVSSAATEIAASAEEMSASVGEVARQCAQASDNAQTAGKTASEGGEVVRQTVSGMQEIDSAVQASAQAVSSLGERGQQIGKVIAVINDIADQTNLLALNAAIEAARAGEHGRGFAVVADEVRKLAERTTKATEEVAHSIKAIQQETKLAVDRMSSGTEQVKQGVQLANQAGENLEQIVQGSSNVAGMIQNISAAAEEAGAATTQSASAAVELSAKAEQLMSMVQRFKIDTNSLGKYAPASKSKKHAAAHN